MHGIKNFLLQKPLVCVFELTKKCNSRCSICSIWERAKDEQLDTEQIRKLFEKLKKMGIYGVYVQGGEPLMHRKIKDILLMLKDDFDLRLISNGIALNENMQDFLIKNKIGLTISLDTLNRETYKKIRGVDKFQTVLENIKNLSKKGYRNVSLHCTVSKVNMHEVLEIRKFAFENGFMFSALPYIYNIGFAGKENSEITYEQKSLIKVFKELEETEKKNNFVLSLVYKDVINFLLGKKIGPCDALKYSIYLTEEGFIAPCIEKKPYMDLKTEPFENILKNEAQKKIVTTCYENTPCYYGCTREVQALRKNIPALIAHPLLTSSSIKQYLSMKK